MAASEGRRPVVRSASCECLQKTSRCASLATRFSGYVTNQARGNFYSLLKCKELQTKDRPEYSVFCRHICRVCYANVIIYIAILYIHIFKIKCMWGREATVWKNGFLWLYFAFQSILRLWNIIAFSECGGPMIGRKLKIVALAVLLWAPFWLGVTHSVRDPQSSVRGPQSSTRDPPEFSQRPSCATRDSQNSISTLCSKRENLVFWGATRNIQGFDYLASNDTPCMPLPFWENFQKYPSIIQTSNWG